MSLIKMPNVAGSFYPAYKEELKASLNQLLQNVKVQTSVPKAIIAPHAGLKYSGNIAAVVYAFLQNAEHYDNIILLGPSHFAGFCGIAYSDFDFFRTPLGDIPVNKALLESLKNVSGLQNLEAAFFKEHCLELQFIFLQTLLKSFKIVPLLVGLADKALVAQVLQLLWAQEKTLIIISSDLSHYLTYDKAKRLDQKTIMAIENLQAEEVTEESACGRYPIRGLLQAAKIKNLQAKNIAYENSGDVTGDKSRVVGYGAFHFYEK